MRVAGAGMPLAVAGEPVELVANLAGRVCIQDRRRASLAQRIILATFEPHDDRQSACHSL